MPGHKVVVLVIVKRGVNVWSRISVFLLFSLGFMSNLSAQEQKLSFTSTAQESRLVELYTSQGCSSCPPAERWMSNFKHDKRLWKSLFPVAFHVDYWDYIGWKDEFAKPEFGKRQRQFQRLGLLNQVATPGFVVSGEGWNGWYRGQRLSSAQTVPALGDLVLSVEGDKIGVSYLSDVIDDKEPSYRVNIALLGFDLLSDIDAGENRGRNLKQDFVVLSLNRSFLLEAKSEREDGANWHGQVRLPKKESDGLSEKALVAWVSQGNDPRPIQIAGGWF